MSWQTTSRTSFSLPLKAVGPRRGSSTRARAGLEVFLFTTPNPLLKQEREYFDVRDSRIPPPVSGGVGGGKKKYV
jgi:hypothetical protein